MCARNEQKCAKNEQKNNPNLLIINQTLPPTKTGECVQKVTQSPLMQVCSQALSNNEWNMESGDITASPGNYLLSSIGNTNSLPSLSTVTCVLSPGENLPRASI